MNSLALYAGSCIFGVAGAILFALAGTGSGKNETLSSAGSAAETAGIDPSSSEPSQASQFTVVIRKPSGPPRVATGVTDSEGDEIRVSCSTCHSNRGPNFANKHAKDMDEFHGALEFSHGTISCLSCHNSNDYDSLKLADGSRIEFSDVMTLCAQCHSAQTKDYRHGAHGGMTGYWDLSKGPQAKNNCVDCHHPHAPQFPKMQPTFKTRDRFLNPEDHSANLQASGSNRHEHSK